MGCSASHEIEESPKKLRGRSGRSRKICIDLPRQRTTPGDMNPLQGDQREVETQSAGNPTCIDQPYPSQHASHQAIALPTKESFRSIVAHDKHQQKAVLERSRSSQSLSAVPNISHTQASFTTPSASLGGELSKSTCSDGQQQPPSGKPLRAIPSFPALPDNAASMRDQCADQPALQDDDDEEQNALSMSQQPCARQEEVVRAVYPQPQEIAPDVGGDSNRAAPQTLSRPGSIRPRGRHTDAPMPQFPVTTDNLIAHVLQSNADLDAALDSGGPAKRGLPRTWHELMMDWVLDCEDARDPLTMSH